MGSTIGGEWEAAAAGILITADDEGSCAGAGGGWDCFVMARGSPTRPVPGIALAEVTVSRDGNVIPHFYESLQVGLHLTL